MSAAGQARKLSANAHDFIDEAQLLSLLDRPADARQVRDIIAKSMAKEPLQVAETADADQCYRAGSRGERFSKRRVSSSETCTATASSCSPRSISATTARTNANIAAFAARMPRQSAAR